MVETVLEVPTENVSNVSTVTLKMDVLLELGVILKVPAGFGCNHLQVAVKNHTGTDSNDKFQTSQLWNSVETLSARATRTQITAQWTVALGLIAPAS